LSIRKTVQTLEETVALHEARIEVLEEEIEKRDRKIEALETRNKHLARQLFGPKSDRPTDEAQGFLKEIMEGLEQSGSEGEEPGQEEVTILRKKKRRKPVGRQMLPEHLERREELVDLPDEEKIDPESGGKLIFIGYDESEQLVEEPAALYVRVIKRAKYALPKEAQGNGRPGVVSAPLPPEYRGPIDKCKVAVGVLAKIITLKYCYHMTLYRLQERYWRMGRVWLPRSTMCGWVKGCAEALEPICKEMGKRIKESGRLGFDDTRVSMLEPKAGKVASTRLWSYSGLMDEAPYQVYDFRLSREKEGPMEFLQGYRGVALGDGLSTNKAVVRRMEGVVLAGCWDHARRYFVDACGEDAKPAAEALSYIKRLYKIEKGLKDDGANAGQRRRIRQEKSVPVLSGFKKWLDEHKEKFLPKSGMSKATNYSLNQWEELNLYVEDGDLPISNCLCEQSFKAIATGRKNWLFFGSEDGGRNAAILYSIIMTCRRLDIDPQKYLEDVLKRVNDHPANRIEELLPDRWKREQIAAGEDVDLRLEDHRPLRKAS
jgi:transposase